MSSHYGPPGRGGGGGGRQGGRQGRGSGPPQYARGGPPAAGRDPRGPPPPPFQRGGGAIMRGGPAGRGGRDGRGGRGRGATPDLSGQTRSLTNIVLAYLQRNFDFFMYTINIQDRSGQAIDSRSRCGALFRMAIPETLFHNLDPNNKRELEKALFFQGSILFSAKPIPGLEADNLPWSHRDEDSADVFEVQRVFHCLAPEEISTATAAPEAAAAAAATTTATSTTTSSEAVTLNLEFDSHRCSGCTKMFDDVLSLLMHCRSTLHAPVFDRRLSGATPAIPGDFITYINLVLDKALGHHFAKWGRDFMDTSTGTIPTDRSGRPLGVTVYQAFSCEFGFLRSKDHPSKKAQIGLTVDLKAKVIRNQTVLDSIYEGCGNPDLYRLNPSQQDQANRKWEGRTVIYTVDHKCYNVIRLIFDHSASTLPVEGLGMSHAEYFQSRKGVTLKHPDATPMVEVLGRRRNAGSIFLPAELICGDELPREIREKLPIICSFSPEVRNIAIEKVRQSLHPDAGGSNLLLPSCGISLRDKRLVAKTTIMSIPQLISAGVPIPAGRENWAPAIQRANFRVNANRAVPLKVVIFYNRNLDAASVPDVYRRICTRVNNFNSKYQFASDQPYAMIPTAGPENYQRHCEDVSNYLQQNSIDNLFVLDFCLPQTREDPAYPAIKQILSNGGHLSQFVSFRTFRHDRQPRDARDRKKGEMIVDGVARQVLQKCGVRLWWVKLPRELPFPALFVGVDIFHAPKEFNPQTRRREARPSCAAVIVQVARRDSEERQSVEIYSETFARAAGQEFELRGALTRAIRNALRLLQVDPRSCIVWRDGIGDGAFGNLAREEIAGIRDGLNNSGRSAIVADATDVASRGAVSSSTVPMAYVVCQKKIKTKFLTQNLAGHPDGKYASPPGTLSDGFQGLKNYTFYIQGRAPPFSTPKPVRYIVVEQDEQLQSLNLPKLTWDLCHEYANWTGSVKVPGVTMMAHKLAELAGVMPNSGGSLDDERDGINHRALVNRLHFL